jgi:hypothetical protein
LDRLYNHGKHTQVSSPCNFQHPTN